MLSSVGSGKINIVLSPAEIPHWSFPEQAPFSHELQQGGFSALKWSAVIYFLT